MTKKPKLEIFSEEFAIKLLESIDEDGLRNAFKSIETFINNGDLHYREVPAGKEFALYSNLEEEKKLKIPKVETYSSKDTINSLLMVIISFIEEKGEKSLESILNITKDKSSEILQNNLILLENLIFKNDIVLNFVIYGSLTRSKKLENYDYKINLESLIFKEKSNIRLVQAPIGYLNLNYLDPQKGKSKSINLAITKRLLKKFKKEINKFYDEFEVYENMINQKSNKEIKDK